MMNTFRLALIGYGRVTQSLVELLVSEKRRIYSQHGLRFEVVAAADSKGAVLSDQPLPAAKLNVIKMDTGSVVYYPQFGRRGLTGLEAIELCDADILVEASPTDMENGQPGLYHITTALTKGMHVVTANKGPLVAAWSELQQLASSKGVQLRYGAAASAGLPILEQGRALADAGQLLEFAGVFNATSNIILHFITQGATMMDGIKEAQKLGLAETDPSLDIQGWDTAVKLLIMANHFWQCNLKLADLNVQGIDKLSYRQLADARGRGNTIKLIGRASLSNDKLSLSVEPVELSSDDPLTHVGGVDKGVVFTTRHMGRQVHYAQGGMDSVTAGTMLADLITIATSLQKIKKGQHY